jgi:hypothetical protein
MKNREGVSLPGFRFHCICYRAASVFGKPFRKNTVDLDMSLHDAFRPETKNIAKDFHLGLQVGDREIARQA